MAHYVAKLLFPNEQSAARQRKMQILCVTLLGGLIASALIALTFIWIYNSGRF